MDKKEYLKQYYLENKVLIKTRGRENYLLKKNEYDKKVKDRRVKNKLKAIAYLGGICKHCTLVYHPSIFEFHHVNPEEKEIKISLLLQSGWDKLKKELDKCILLCANCHNYHHYNTVY